MNNTIVVITNGSSCTNASFTLARSLQEKGNRILYIDLNNNPSYIEKQGFEVLSINVPAFIYNEYQHPVRYIFLRRLRQRIRAYMRLQEFTNYHCDQWLQENKVDLVLLDANLPGFAVPLLKNKIPVINISSTLASLNPNGAPPVFSGLFPRSPSDPLSGLKIKMSWMKIFLAQGLRDLLEKLLIRIESKGSALPVPDQIRLQGGHMKRTEYGLRLVAPEIILSPKCIDFASQKNGGNKLYAGACVYEDRKQELTGFEHIISGENIIYCSLGTCSATYAYKEHFYRCLLEAMENFKQYQLILQTDEPLSDEIKIPDNVKVFRSVPQLEILRKAKAFITHGGASSFREGIYYGTPMIIFPGWHNQLGNAARVVYYGIGLKGSMKNITTPKLISMLSEVLSNSRILRSVREMQKEAVKKEEIIACTEFIERLLKTNDLIAQRLYPKSY